VPTIGDTLSSLENELFVGREQELTRFQLWLETGAPAPGILNVTGRGGIGKSALLRAFVRLARSQDRPALLVDSRDFPHTLEGFHFALFGGGVDDVFGRINRLRPVLLLDTFEEMGELYHYLETEFLPRLDAGVRVVIAGRLPLSRAWSADSPWQRIVHQLPLEALTPEQAREYLRRRGLKDPSLVEQIAQSATGNPLALSLSADMALQLGTRNFPGSHERHMMIRSLVERLLREVDDPLLREMLEACAIVRQFDEPTLAAISGQAEVGPILAKVCQLSAVRAAEHGLMLHDDVRRAILEDLRWRNPERHRELRLRALAYYRERMRSTPPQERPWLLGEHLFLWENAFAQAALFGYDEAEPVLVETARLEDTPAVLGAWEACERAFTRDVLGLEGPMPGRRAFLEALFRYRGTRTRIARDNEGQVVAFSIAVPVCRESLPLFELDIGFAPQMRGYWSPAERAELPATHEDSDIWCLVLIGWLEEAAERVSGAMMRDQTGLFALGGTYIVITPYPFAKAYLRFLGFEPVERLANWRCGDKHPVETFVLDLRTVGVERWLESILGGRSLPKPMSLSEIEDEVRRVMRHWHEDSHLADSPLLHLPQVATPDSGGGRVPVLRQTILGALATARSKASPDQAEAYQALEYAYLQRVGSLDRSAQRMTVSRATFFRLLKRGFQGLAAELGRPAEG